MGKNCAGMAEQIRFVNSRGLKLAGELLWPDKWHGPPAHDSRAGRPCHAEPPYSGVVFAHGMYSSKGSPRNRAIAERLREQGIACLLFDFTGHGESEGELEDAALEEQADDLRAALDQLQAHPDRVNRIGVHGSSTGGTAAVWLAAEDRRIQVLVLRAPRSAGLLERAARVKAPTLIIQGGADWQVRQESERLMPALAGEKGLELVEGAGHLFEEPGAMEKAAELAVSWFLQHLLPARPLW